MPSGYVEDTGEMTLQGSVMMMVLELELIEERFVLIDRDGPTSLVT